MTEENESKPVELGEGRLIERPGEHEEFQGIGYPVLYGDELDSATGDFAFGNQRGRGDVIKLSGKWYSIGAQIRINQPVEVFFEGAIA